MPSDAAPDRDATPEEFISRAELLADLGRYDEAAAELGFAIALDPANEMARTVLARVHLAAGRPAEALTATDMITSPAADAVGSPAADAVGSPAATGIDNLAARAMALIDLRRFTEAAKVAEEILRRGPDDPEALCTGAALLSESRNGQQALDAAWRAVELAPDRANTHLVLGLVAGRLQQFQLAEQAYRKALELDPALTDVHTSIGIIQLEQRRYTEALASLADAAAARRPADGSADPTWQAPDPVALGVRHLLRFGAGYALVVPVLVACAAAGNTALGRMQAGALGIIGLGILAVLATRLPGRPLPVLRPLMSADRAIAVAVYAVAAAPCLVLLYAALATPWLLVAAIGAGIVALIANMFPAGAGFSGRA